MLTAAEVGRLRHASRSPGVAGAESNVAIGARRLGCPAAWVGRVGEDELGELVVSRIRAEGVDVGGVVRDPGAPTSLMLKERRTADMVRVLYYRRNGPGSRLQPADVDPAQVAAAGVLHVTGITRPWATARATVDHAVELARAARVRSPSTQLPLGPGRPNGPPPSAATGPGERVRPAPTRRVLGWRANRPTGRGWPT